MEEKIKVLEHAYNEALNNKAVVAGTREEALEVIHFIMSGIASRKGIDVTDEEIDKFVKEHLSVTDKGLEDLKDDHKIWHF